MEPIRKISVNYGIVLGVLLILAGAIVYAIDVNLLTNTVYSITTFLLIATLGILAAIKGKAILGGFMSYKQSFTAFFITVLIGLVANMIFSYILLNVVDPEAKEIITENVIKSSVEMAESFGAKTEDINKIVTDLQESDNFGLMGQLRGLAISIVFYSVIGLIAALVIRRNPPESL